jgi:hypothetical protein
MEQPNFQPCPCGCGTDARITRALEILKDVIDRKKAKAAQAAAGAGPALQPPG